jgi:hypothetical protein
MDQPKKAKVPRSVNKEEATPEVAPQFPVQELEAPVKPKPAHGPKNVRVQESGLTIEDY